MSTRKKLTVAQYTDLCTRLNNMGEMVGEMLREITRGSKDTEIEITNTQLATAIADLAALQLEMNQADYP